MTTFPVVSSTSATTNGVVNMGVHVAISPASSLHQIAAPKLRSQHRLFDLSDNATFLAVYCFVKNFIGATGTSTVAIDNKIEQAMDLVKSHLMFAVREEVEVLKEKISELMDRINQLEYENSVLKANASQETLAQLTSNNQQPQQQNPPAPSSST